MAQLTKMQQKIYDYIVQAIQDQGYPPSVREIGEAVGLKSPSTVHFHLKHLEELGVIGKQAGKGRALTLTEAPQENQVPIVGNVAAGSPILAQECIEDYLTFDTGGRDGEYFALRVRGESMINAGILPDDLVVVHQQPAANNGEIVVALLGDEAAVKRLARRQDTQALRELLTAAARRGSGELVVQVGYFDHQEEEVRSIVDQVQAMEAPEQKEPWTVNFYPEGGDVGIIEILLKKS